jgi:hypothetical protein
MDNISKIYRNDTVLGLFLLEADADIILGRLQCKYVLELGVPGKPIDTGA